MRARRLRAALAGVLLAGLTTVPLLWLAQFEGGWVGSASAAFEGLLAAIDAVGWVFVPQLVLGIGVLGAALHHLLSRVAGTPAPGPPAWIDPAIESVLLLGLLGTVMGMVEGFVGLSPDELEPAPLIHGLGAGLYSSMVGFSIALVGVWVRALPMPEPHA